MPKIEITNSDKGPRGIRTVDGLVTLAPGETQTLDVTADEAADLPGYFSTGKTVPGEPEGDGLDGLKVAELDKIIADEDVTVPETGTGANGRVVAADKAAAIRAKRAAPPAGPEGDTLDGMTDEELRATVQALTGEEAPADADRAALLALARTE